MRQKIITQMSKTPNNFYEIDTIEARIKALNARLSTLFRKADKILKGPPIDVTFWQLQDFPWFTEIELTGGVKAKRLPIAQPSEKNLALYFAVFFEKGADLGLHIHSDCKEVLYIESGQLIDLVTGQIYKAGEVANIPTAEKHHFKDLGEGCNMYVYFSLDD